jgi:hypothetical protein
MMDEVQKTSNSEYYTPSLEAFRIYEMCYLKEHEFLFVYDMTYLR